MGVHMKILIVGGTHQGKTEYALRRYGIPEDQLWDVAKPGDWREYPALNRLHLLAESVMKQGLDPQKEIRGILGKKQDWILICDEVGCGVVPMDAFARRWREEVGRLCCALAQEADVVELVTCGLPVRVKGGLA